MNIKNTTRHHERKPTPLKPARAILWYPISYFFFETVSGNEFFYFYRNSFSISVTLIGGAFRTMKYCVDRSYPTISIFLKFYSCIPFVKISVTISRDWLCFIKFLYSNTLDFSMTLFLKVLPKMTVFHFE